MLDLESAGRLLILKVYLQISGSLRNRHHFQERAVIQDLDVLLRRHKLLYVALYVLKLCMNVRDTLARIISFLKSFFMVI